MRDTSFPSDDELRQLEGLREALLLRDEESGKLVTLTFWESREHLEKSAARANALRQTIADSAGAREAPLVEVYELVKRTIPREA